MMSKDRKKIIDCIREREDLFRDRHQMLASLPVQQQQRPWQKLKTNPAQNEDAGIRISPSTGSCTKGTIHDISITVPPLQNLSCQLQPHVHGELLRLYPLGTPGGRDDVDNAFDLDSFRMLSAQFAGRNGIKVLGTSGWGESFLREKCLQDYDANFDATILLRDAEAVLHASGKKVAQFKNSTVIPFSHQSRKKDPEGKPQIGSRCDAAPSLFSLSQRVAAPAIAPNFRALEDSFVDELRKAHSDAVAAMDDLEARAKRDVIAINTGPKMDKVLKFEAELLEVKARLEAAKRALYKTKDETRKYYREHGQDIQEEYDAKRADLAADYIENRNKMENEFSSAYFGLKVCKRCVQPFEPHSRGSLPGWKRCSVVGCSSAEDYCLDCSSAPCPRCFAPICSAHECPHEFECKVKPRCGYYRDSDDVTMGIEHGCCGEAAGQRTACKKCMVERCGKCQVRGLCPACDLFQREMTQEKPPVKAVVGSGEYFKERERHGFPKTLAEATDKHQKVRRGAYGSVICRIPTKHFILKKRPPIRSFQGEEERKIAARNALDTEETQKKRKRDSNDTRSR